MKFFKIIFPLLILFFACKSKNQAINVENTNQEFEFIQKIKLSETVDFIEITSGNEVVNFQKKDLPLQSAMVIPTVVLTYMDELNLLDKVTGISQPNYLFNPKVHQLIQENKMDEIGGFNEIYIEKVLMNKPDVFISTSGPAMSKYHEILKNEGIKVIYIDEYEELEPLARAEYVKIFGQLFGKEKEAEELFSEIKTNYNKTKELIQTSNFQKPSLMANQIFGDIWYMPGGKSFQAQLFKDANANYLWADTENETTLQLSFESVFEKAADADVWVNAGDFPNLESLISSYANYEWFKAVKNKLVYNYAKRTSKTGANDYFETGTARPDWVLKDLAKIFYPELFPEHELYFYKKLE